jgi:hypothetical protein
MLPLASLLEIAAAPPAPAVPPAGLWVFLSGESLNKFLDSFLKLAATLGGVWWFARRSLYRARLNLEQTVKVLRCENQGKPDLLLKVFLKVTNIGEVPFRLSRLDVGALQCLPLPCPARRELAKRANGFVVIDDLPVDPDPKKPDAEREVPWHGLASRTAWPEPGVWELDLRPGESDTILATIQLTDKDLEQVVVLSQIFRGKDWRPWSHELAWRAHTMVDVRPPKDSSDTTPMLL